MSSLAAISSFVRTPSCSRRSAAVIFLTVIFLGRPRSDMIKIPQGSFRTSYSTCTSPSTATRMRRPAPLQRAIPCRRMPCTVLTIPALISASCRPSRWNRHATGASRGVHISNPALFTVHLPPESRHVTGSLAPESPRRTFRTLADDL